MPCAVLAHETIAATFIDMEDVRCVGGDRHLHAVARAFERCARVRQEFCVRLLRIEKEANGQADVAPRLSYDVVLAR